MTLASLLATAVATAMPATRAGAVTTTTAGGSASLLPEFPQIAEKPPAVVEAKIPTEPPVPVQVTVVGAKSMHKVLKGSNEMTTLLFVGAADDEAAVGEATTPIHPALKGLVSQFKDSVLTSELKNGVPNSKLTHKIEPRSSELALS